MLGVRTFIFQKVAHASASGQHELRNIFDNLGFVFRRESREPFRQSLDE